MQTYMKASLRVSIEPCVDEAEAVSWELAPKETASTLST